MRCIFEITQNPINTPDAKKSSWKFREAQNYLKTKVFIRSTKYSMEDIENALEK